MESREREKRKGGKGRKKGVSTTIVVSLYGYQLA
jgi:hypothetical protein